MTTWINPIYDRTQADVDYAKAQIEYFKQYGGITDGVAMKGCLNDVDLNRIENNCDYIGDLLASLCYYNHIDRYDGSWSLTSVPDTSHINRIIGNVKKMQDNYFKPSASPTLPTTLTHYEDVNSLEKCLYLLKVMIDNMTSSFKQCGTFTCGEE